MLLDTDKYARFAVRPLWRRQQVALCRQNTLLALASSPPRFPLFAGDLPVGLTTYALLRARWAAERRHDALMQAVSRLAMPTLDIVPYSPALALRRAELYPGGLRVYALSGVGRSQRAQTRPRGRITGKSPRSRRRQMMMLMRLRPVGAVTFVTLTLSDALVASCLAAGGLTALHQNFARALNLLQKRFERAFPSASALWSKEVMPRKSGDHTGVLVPHVHLLVFQARPSCAPDVELLPAERSRAGKSELALRLQAWFKSNWSDVWRSVTSIDDAEHRRRGADVVEMQSRKVIVAYVSKYMSKQSSAFDEAGEVIYTGRWWGYWGASRLPLHPGLVLHLSDDEVVNLRRLVKRWLRARGKRGEVSQPALRFADRLCRQRLCDGFVVFGFGIELLGARASPTLGLIYEYARLPDDTECQLEALALWRLFDALSA